MFKKVKSKYRVSQIKEEKKYSLFLTKAGLMDERNLELKWFGKIIKEKLNIPKTKLNLGFIKKDCGKDTGKKVFLEYKFNFSVLLTTLCLPQFFKPVHNKYWNQKKNFVLF